MGHLQSFKNLKMESGEDDGGWKRKTQCKSQEEK